MPGARILERVREAVQLVAMVRRGPDKAVESTIRTFELTQQRVRDLTGVVLERKRILEIGPGQQLRTLRCFSLANDVTGIDMDVIAQSLAPRELIRMLRANPPLRTAKTVLRKALGFDARFAETLARRLSVPGFAPIRVLRMDAAHTDFGDESFDFVCSFSVFEHIEHPEEALREIARVLAPGGVAYILTHLWTSNSGHHDPRIVAGDLPPPYWPHLRPEFERTVQYTTYCNRLRLPAWKEIFTRAMPGARFILEGQPEFTAALRELRAAGALADYADDELLSSCLVTVWQKGGAAATAETRVPGAP